MTKQKELERLGSLDNAPEVDLNNGNSSLDTGAYMFKLGKNDDNEGSMLIITYHDSFHSKSECPFEIPEMINGKKVTCVMFRCENWNVKLPKTVKKIIIERKYIFSTSMYGYEIRYHQNFGLTSSIEVDPANPIFVSENGFLLSKDDKSKLYFVSKHGEITIPDSVTVIEEEAVGGDFEKIVVPAGIHTIKRNQFVGSAKTLEFKGAINEIEEGAFDHFNLRGELIVNGLVSEMSQASAHYLYNYIMKQRKGIHNLSIRFNAPQITGRKLAEGLLELHSEINNETKLALHADYEPITISTDKYIPVETDDNKNVKYSVYYRKHMLMDEYNNAPIFGTEVGWITPDGRETTGMLVHEAYEDIIKLITE